MGNRPVKNPNIRLNPDARHDSRMTMSPEHFHALHTSLTLMMTDSEVIKTLRARAHDPLTFTPTRNRWDLFWALKDSGNIQDLSLIYTMSAMDTALNRILPATSPAGGPHPASHLPHPVSHLS